MTILNGYCTEDELREQLGDAASEFPASLLHRAINSASRDIDEYCGRRFWQDPTPTVRTYRPEYATKAWVEDISTTTGLVVKVDSGLDGTFATTWTLNAEFILKPDNAAQDSRPWFLIEAVDGNAFYASQRPTLQVTARHGPPALPSPINEASILRAGALFMRRKSINGVAGFDGFGVVRISSRRDPDVVELIHPFRRADIMVA